MKTLDNWYDWWKKTYIAITTKIFTSLKEENVPEMTEVLILQSKRLHYQKKFIMAKKSRYSSLYNFWDGEGILHLPRYKKVTCCRIKIFLAASKGIYSLKWF